MVTDTIEAKIDRLRRADFGSWREAAFRYSIVAGSAILLYLATSHLFFLYWISGYLIAETIFAAVLHIKPDYNPKLHFAICIAAYNFSACVFVIAPLSLIATDDSALVMVGAIGLVGLLLYNLHRWDTDPEIAFSEWLQFGGTLVVLMIILYPRIESQYQFATASFASIGTFAFYHRATRARLHQTKSLRAAQIRYAQSQKARALNQFVGGVAHDFNNILTAIIGNLELHGALDDEVERKQTLRDAQDAAARAATTVRQLLATSGRARLRPVALRASILHEQMEAVLHDLLDSGIRLISEPEDPDFSAFADRDMLETVLIQLCLNAQDAMKGQGTIWLRSAKVTERPDCDTQPEAPPPYLAIIIEDNGPGASPQSLPMLTEPFFTTKPVGHGPGLGLSAVLGLARQSQGTLHLENRVQGGMRATLFLPQG